MPSWNFSPQDGKLFVYRNGSRIVNDSGKHELYPDVLDVKVPAETQKMKGNFNAKKGDALKIVFTNNKTCWLKVSNFVWNSNSFCKNFKNAKSNEEFCKTYQLITSYDSSAETQQPIGNVDIGDGEVFEDDEIIPDTQMPFLSSVKHQMIQASGTKGQDQGSSQEINDKMIKGIFDVNIEQIQESPEHIRLRDIDYQFVDQITKELEHKRNWETVPQPLAIYLQNISKTEFNPEKINDYKFVCLGGNHLRCAYEKIKKKNIPTKIFVELTDEECLLVSKMHNDISHHVKAMTNFDMVQLFRRQLSLLTSVDTRVTNQLVIKEWRGKISKLLPNNKDIRSYQPLLNLAMFGEELYLKIVKIFKMYEQSDLKDQKEMKKGFSKQTLESIGLWRALMTLEEETLNPLLNQVIENQLSLQQLQKVCEEKKAIKKMKMKMVEQVGKDWPECVEMFYDGDEEDAEDCIHPYIKLPDVDFTNYIKTMRRGSSSTSSTMKTSTSTSKADLVYISEDEVSEDIIRDIHSKNIAANISCYTVVSPSTMLKLEAQKVAEFAFGAIAYTTEKNVQGTDLREIKLFHIAQFGSKKVRALPGKTKEELYHLEDDTKLLTIFEMFTTTKSLILLITKNEQILRNFSLLNCNTNVVVKSELDRKSLKRKYHFLEE